MAKYTINHSCGHEATHQLVGPHKERERKIQWLEGTLCEECWKADKEKSRLAAAKAAADEAKEQELPDLIGSEKQITWALRIRQEILSSLAEETDNISNSQKLYAENKTSRRFRGIGTIERWEDRLNWAVDYLLNQNKASWWIDNRQSETLIILDKLMRIAVLEKPAIEPTAEELAVLNSETLVIPENKVTDITAEITADENSVSVLFPEKLENFRVLMHELGFKWNSSRWFFKVDILTGASKDRAAEAGNKILGIGVSIRINNEIRQMAISGTFEPRHSKWITNSSGVFRISWNKKHDYYREAKRIAGSKYKDGAVFVTADNLEEVLDFAKTNGFWVSPGAIDLAEKTKAIKDAALITNPVEVESEEPHRAGKRIKPNKLTIPTDADIDPEFKE